MAKYITILNYPGSKKRLLDFINDTVDNNLMKGKVVLDIFSGTSAVAYSLKDRYLVYANDSEVFAYHIANALLADAQTVNFEQLLENIKKRYLSNYNKLTILYPEIIQEQALIKEGDTLGLVNFYKKFTCIYEEGFTKRSEKEFSLFTEYYSNSYFGLKQSIQIDSLRYAFEEYKNNNIFSTLLSSLYYSMKEAVFSKDGHMAQPLNLEKNKNVLIKRRKKDLVNDFIIKLKDFFSKDYVLPIGINRSYNFTLDDVLEKNILNGVDLVYADPPYTDMQYSRYYHLLETVTKYDYPKMSFNRGKVTAGLYRESRYQSPLSQFSRAKNNIEKLIKECKEREITVVFSYAYPVDTEKQHTNRYTMNINELIEIFYQNYGIDNTEVLSEEFFHSNNRNKENKKVYEYLIVGKGKK